MYTSTRVWCAWVFLHSSYIMLLQNKWPARRADSRVHHLHQRTRYLSLKSAVGAQLVCYFCWHSLQVIFVWHSICRFAADKSIFAAICQFAAGVFTINQLILKIFDRYCNVVTSWNSRLTNEQPGMKIRCLLRVIILIHVLDNACWILSH